MPISTFLHGTYYVSGRWSESLRMDIGSPCADINYTLPRRNSMSVKQKMSVAKKKMSMHGSKISAFRNKNKPAKSSHPARHPGGSNLSAAIPQR